MKQRWKTLDTVVAIIFVFIFGMSILLSLTFFLNFFWDKEVVEEEIQFKMSEKGIFLSPIYKAYSKSSGMHRISKQQYEEDDVLAGYTTDRYSFFTKMDLLVELKNTLLILLFLLGLCSLLGYYFYRKFYSKHRSRQIINKKSFKKTTTILHYLYISIASIILLCLCWYTWQQVMPHGQTETQATILDREVIKRYGKYNFNKHYVTFSYEDDSGTTHIAKQRVYAGLYQKYEKRNTIPIRYVDRQPANTMIVLQSFEDIVWQVLWKNIVIILIILYGYKRIYRWAQIEH